MSHQAAAKEDFKIIECGEVLDISVTAELRTQLLTVLESKKSVMLDASQVERADTAALQVLSAFVQDANSQQQTVQWKKPSEALFRSAELLGLSGLLKLTTNQAE